MAASPGSHRFRTEIGFLGTSPEGIAGSLAERERSCLAFFALASHWSYLLDETTHEAIRTPIGRRITLMPGWLLNAVAMLLIGALSACGSQVDLYLHGTELVDVFVNTDPPGASCTLTRGGQQVASIAVTPGIAWLPENTDVTVLCRRSAFNDASATAHVRAQPHSLKEYFGGTPPPPEAGATVIIKLPAKSS